MAEYHTRVNSTGDSQNLPRRILYIRTFGRLSTTFIRLHTLKRPSYSLKALFNLVLQQNAKLLKLLDGQGL